MRCKVCGKEVRETAKYCPGCGSCIADQTSVDTGAGGNAGRPPVNTGVGSNAGNVPVKNKKPMAFIVILIIVIVAILAVVGIFLWKGASNDKSEKGETAVEVSTESSTGEAGTEDIGSITIATTEEEKTESTAETAGVSIATTENDASAGNGGLSLEYCNNSYCGIDNNMSKEDFQYVESPNGDYHFYYPKYLYNNWSYSDENGFYFSFESGGTTTTSLHVYSEDCAGDMIKNGENLSASFKGSLAKVGYTFPDNIAKKGPGDDNVMQVVVSGWTDSGRKTGKYMCGANDGSKNYVIEITYPDADPANYVETWDYIVDTLYRYCSFSGSTKAPYSNYNTFYKEYK